MNCYWNEKRINIIDTPGHVDFTMEVERSLRVLDGMVGVFCGVAGVQPQSETVWKQADRYEVPRIIFVNKMDRTGADYFKAIESVNTRLRGNSLAMQIPVGQSEDFIAIIDVLTSKIANFEDDGGIKVIWNDAPLEYKDQIARMRTSIIERASDFDDELAEKYLSGEEISLEEIKKALRKGVLQRKIAPTFCGTAFKNKGIQLMLDAVVDYLPAPIDVAAIKGISMDGESEISRSANDDEPFAALAFKIMTDPFVGRLTFCRCYSGKLEAGSIMILMYPENRLKSKLKRRNSMVKIHNPLLISCLEKFNILLLKKPTLSKPSLLDSKPYPNKLFNPDQKIKF